MISLRKAMYKLQICLVFSTVLCCCAAAVDDSRLPAALADDDQCASGECGMNAIQLRSRTSASGSSCDDKNSQCSQEWVNEQKCASDSYWRWQCPKKCKVCTDDAEGVSSPTATTTPLGDDGDAAEVKNTTADAADVQNGTAAVPAGVGNIDPTKMPWTYPSEPSLNHPSSAPLYEFYVYRAVSDEVYPPLNVNTGSLAGVLWYLHHEVVVQAPRKFSIKRILRYKIRMRGTEPLARLGMHFGVRVAFDKGQATGPFVCGRTEVGGDMGGSHFEPQFCGGPPNATLLEWISPYTDTFNWARYGFHVGCNNLGEYPFPMEKVYYPGAIWYSFPGLCPSKLYNEKEDGCTETEPGGYCPGVEPTGNGTCTWNYEEAGEIRLDDLVGITDYDTWIKTHQEYDPYSDKGKNFDWWDGLENEEKNRERLRQAQALFDKKYPDAPSAASDADNSPKCDFAYGPFYRDWYRKSGYSGPCGEPTAKCKGNIEWAKQHVSDHPSWYAPLTANSSDDEFQRLLYSQSKGDCKRPPPC